MWCIKFNDVLLENIILQKVVLRNEDRVSCGILYSILCFRLFGEYDSENVVLRNEDGKKRAWLIFLCYINLY